MKTVDECLYCGEHDSTDRALTDCEFVKNFVNWHVIDWFNAVNNLTFTPTMEEKLFDIKYGPYRPNVDTVKLY